MDKRTQRILEFDKIINKLSSLAASSLGKELAAGLEPDTDYDRIIRLQKETQDGTSCIMRRGSPPLGGIHDIRASVKRAEIGGVINPGELLRIADTLRAGRNLKNYMDEGPEEEENTISSLVACIETNRRVEDKITRCIVSEDEISDHASPALYDARRKIKDLQNSIKDRLNDLVKSQKYQKFMQDTLVTMRGDRYVVPVKQEYRSEIPGLVHDASSSGATLFIEPMVVVEANNSIKQLRVKEQLEIERILSELSGEVAAIGESLKSNVSIFSQLDFIFAKAKLSVDYKCVCPVLNREKRISIKKGRHPLLDQKLVVPIDFWIGDKFKTLVVTGPNTGGKTVTLKTVGLFTLMAQAGLHIPAAEGTEMGVFQKVFADIGDEQSIEQSLSTFSSHMVNIVEILKHADDTSMVLFDELGAGTDPTEGAALAMSLLETLHQLGAISIATTHYSELKAYAISTKGVENASCEFDVKTLKPTYKLLIGVPGKSNAFAISRRLGLDEAIVERAKEFLSHDEIRFEDILHSIEKNRSIAENERIKAEKIRHEIEDLKKEMENQKGRLNQQRDRMLKEAREEARSILLKAREESSEILEKIKELEKERESEERRRVSQEMRQKLSGSINGLEASLSEAAIKKHGFVAPPKNLKPGDSVLIVNLNQKGSVISPPDKDGEAIIQAGIMKINVHVTNLKLIDEQEKEIRKYGSGKIGMSKSKSISTEIDVRGYMLEEGLDTVDKYLDDAALAGLKEITIIHGKGTGVLRNGIHSLLKSNHHVKGYRLGRYGEGESGVTVVELK